MYNLTYNCCILINYKEHSLEDNLCISLCKYEDR